MSGAWAARLAGGGWRALGGLRRRFAVEVCEEGDRLWIRGGELAPELERALAGLDLEERLAVAADGRLRRPGGRVPRGRLPEGDWVALERWLATELPPSRLPARTAGAVPLRLGRGGAERAPEAWLGAWPAFARWALGASAVRLARLRFARSADDRALVLGAPLPPLCGTPHTGERGLLVPCGLEWRPRVDPALVRTVLGLADGELARLVPAVVGQGAVVGEVAGDREVTAHFEVLRAEAFVPAARSAVRRTVEERSRERLR